MQWRRPLRVASGKEVAVIPVQVVLLLIWRYACEESENCEIERGLVCKCMVPDDACLAVAIEAKQRV